VVKEIMTEQMQYWLFLRLAIPHAAADWARIKKEPLPLGREMSVESGGRWRKLGG
jgi:hypothetical protein